MLSWRCRDYVNPTRTLVEVGILYLLDDPVGLVLYDGGNTGTDATHRREGLNRVWTWGPNNNDFLFVIKPDGTGLYYDFSKVPVGETKKPEEVYKCYQMRPTPQELRYLQTE